ncbi:hypothetical protein Btru_054074 [Bulinus truncatus]|nr:hypothetical protein Btru_054074 [Bulinus truncatus]
MKDRGGVKMADRPYDLLADGRGGRNDLEERRGDHGGQNHSPTDHLIQRSGQTPPGDDVQMSTFDGKRHRETRPFDDDRDQQGRWGHKVDSPESRLWNNGTASCTTHGEDSTSEIVQGDTTLDNVSKYEHIKSSWYLLVVVLTPCLLSPIIFTVEEKYEREARCGYIIALMAIYWTTEALPIAVTSLLPVVLMPVLGVMSTRDISGVYINEVTMLFIGGYIMAIATEVWHVHKRIALAVLRVVGAEPKSLLFGIASVTWFLSMWMSNSAAAAMMVTIVRALLHQFEQLLDVGQTEYQNGDVDRYDLRPLDSSDLKKRKDRSRMEFQRLSKALSLTVAYSANIGGLASLTGSRPNLVLYSASQKVFNDVGLQSPISFSTWLLYGLPLSFMLEAVVYMWMVTFYLRCRAGCLCCCCLPKKDQHLRQMNAIIRDEYNKLGPVTFAQGTVLASLILLIIMWITRDLGGVGGWGEWLPKGIGDATPAILFGCLMFMLPSSLPRLLFSTSNGQTEPYTRLTPLLTWRQVHDLMPWSLVFLIGAGYAIAHASKMSGLSTWMGDQLLVFQSLDQWVILLVISYIVTFLTEVTSNVAIATLMMPILAQMAISLEVNPLFLMFPIALATSFAFMLPVATPPNAIVFASGSIRVIDMVISGMFLNIVCPPILILATATWGNAVFRFDQVPPEFLTNRTMDRITVLPSINQSAQWLNTSGYL